jgi:hypothetical protein
VLIGVWTHLLPPCSYPEKYIYPAGKIRQSESSSWTEYGAGPTDGTGQEPVPTVGIPRHGVSQRQSRPFIPRYGNRNPIRFHSDVKSPAFQLSGQPLR